MNDPVLNQIFAYLIDKNKNILTIVHYVTSALANSTRNLALESVDDSNFKLKFNFDQQSQIDLKNIFISFPNLENKNQHNLSEKKRIFVIHNIF